MVRHARVYQRSGASPSDRKRTAHGEYKTPRGKLVIADLDVRDGRPTKVAVSSDFFLEPPEALAEITRTLRGAPAEDAASLEDRAREVLRRGHKERRETGRAAEGADRAAARGDHRAHDRGLRE
jgi:lipoate-protein ligase A